LRSLRKSPFGPAGLGECNAQRRLSVRRFEGRTGILSRYRPRRTAKIGVPHAE
jgi:hypothetical protein